MERNLPSFESKMERRDFLKLAALSLIQPPINQPNDFGWRAPDSESTTPRFYNLYPEGQGKGKIVLLYNYYQASRGHPMIPHNQGNNPDCTAHAASLGIETLETIQHLLMKQTYLGNIATEILHIGARLIIAKRTKGGVAVDEVVKFAQNYGNLFRKLYKNCNGSCKLFDFTKYNYNNAIRLNGGIPNWLLEECKKHPIQNATLVKNYKEARDAIYALQPVIIGSTVGFDPPKRNKNRIRDSQGFLKPKGEWYHAWLLIGINDKGRRKGGCLMSSHGTNWVSGPKSYSQPDGSIWVDQHVLNKMVNEYGDSYAISNFKMNRYQLYSGGNNHG